MSDDTKTVALVGCGDYGREHVLESVKKAIDLMGGMGRFVKPGMKVLVKPNLLRATPIQRNVTTHPEVVFAVAKLAKECGGEVVMADSPGGGTPYTLRSLRRSYHAAGLDKVAEELDVKLNLSLASREIGNPLGKKIHRFVIIGPALDADLIINVSKMKTHLFTYMTGATKNMFGVIPSIEKATFHSRMRTPDEFGEMLVDLNELVRPGLQVMDAVEAMQGNGPNSGETVKIGAILASSSYSAIDVVASKIMSIEPGEVGAIKAAAARKLVRKDFSDVEVVGDPLGPFVRKDFKKPETYTRKRNTQGPLWAALSAVAKPYALRPVFSKEKCIGCGMCVRICPEKAIALRGKKAKVDYRKCIRCYSCHETCPNDAISLKRNMAGKAMKRIVK